MSDITPRELWLPKNEFRRRRSGRNKKVNIEFSANTIPGGGVVSHCHEPGNLVNNFLGTRKFTKLPRGGDGDPC